MPDFYLQKDGFIGKVRPKNKVSFDFHKHILCSEKSFVFEVKN